MSLESPAQAGQAKPAQQQQKAAVSEPTVPRSPVPLSRREQFALHFGAAILSNQASGRRPDALARQVVDFTDAFLMELDSPKGA